MGRINTIKRAKGIRKVKPEEVRISRQLWRKYQRGEMNREDLAALVTELAKQLAIEIADDKSKGDIEDVNMVFRLIACLILHDNYGFGHKRLMDFLAEIDEQIDAIYRGYVSRKDVEETLLKECRIEVKLPTV